MKHSIYDARGRFTIQAHHIRAIRCSAGDIIKIVFNQNSTISRLILYNGTFRSVDIKLKMSYHVEDSDIIRISPYILKKAFGTIPNNIDVVTDNYRIILCEKI